MILKYAKSKEKLYIWKKLYELCLKIIEYREKESVNKILSMLNV